MCQGITHGWPSSRSTLSWGLQVHRCLLRRIHGCVIPGRSSTKGSVGPSGTCFSYAGVPSSSEGGAYAEESCSDGLARHPAGTAKTLGRRWWCTLNRHLVRSRFSETFPSHHRWAWNMRGYMENLSWTSFVFQKSMLMLPLLLSWFLSNWISINTVSGCSKFSFLKHRVCDESIRFVRISNRVSKWSPVENDDTMILYVTDIYKYFIQRASPAWRNI